MFEGVCIARKFWRELCFYREKDFLWRGCWRVFPLYSLALRKLRLLGVGRKGPALLFARAAGQKARIAEKWSAEWEARLLKKPQPSRTLLIKLSGWPRRERGSGAG